MRWVLSLLIVALSVCAWELFYFFSAPPLDPEQKALQAWEGVRAPDFSVKTGAGGWVHLADFKGKRVLLNFWATWCPPCLEELPNFIKLRAMLPPADVAILGMSTDDAAAQEEFAQRHGINYPLGIMRVLPPPYEDVEKIPTTLVIDRHGVVQHVLFGPQDFDTLRRYATEPDFTGKPKLAPDTQPSERETNL